MEKGKDRIQSLDFIKIIAMLSVMGLHSTYSFIDESHIGVADIIYRTSVIAIPLFFMVSGFLLLGRTKVDYRYVFMGYCSFCISN